MKNTTTKNDKPEKADILGLNEAIIYPGLDRLGIAQPDQAMYRLKSLFHTNKILRN